MPVPAPPRWSYALYDVVGTALGLASLPFLPFLLLSRHGEGVGERLGRLPLAVRRLQRPVWVHAASVGEVIAAQPLLQRLRARHPDLSIMVSTTSVTGRETARTRLGVDAVTLLPVDIGWIVGRVLRRMQPRCVIILETEIWPALIRAAAQQRIPLLIVSGRLSARAAVRYARIRRLTQAVLPQVNAFAMQTADDAARIVALGAPAARVQVVGSLKFARDASTPAGPTHGPAAEVAAQMEGRTLLIAASTHPGEERLVLEACASLWDAFPDLLLLIAPRRPERFDEVEQLLARSGVRAERRSRLRQPAERAIQVLLLDTVGELPNLLQAARAVFVGGTIAPIGGHNVLEPAVFGKPVAFGPQTADVAETAAALLDAGAATRVVDAAGLHDEWRRLLEDPAAAAEMGARGRAVVTARAAVAERTADLVCGYLDEGRGSELQ